MSAYQWKSGSRIRADAQASGELMERLAASEEGLTAKTLLEANKPKSAPLHDYYEWNDVVAAEEWRLHQSRNAINSIIRCDVKSTDEIGDEQPVRAFFITTESNCYDSIQAIVQDEDKYSVLLRQAYAELTAFQRKYEALKELTPIFEAMKEVKA